MLTPGICHPSATDEYAQRLLETIRMIHERANIEAAPYVRALYNLRAAHTQPLVMADAYSAVPEQNVGLCWPHYKDQPSPSKKDSP